jgi:hypothetical protein
MISRGGAIAPIDPEVVEFHPDIDVSTIRTDFSLSGFTIYESESADVSSDCEVSGIGHADFMPQVDAKWDHEKLLIEAADLSLGVCDRDGRVLRQFPISIEAKDVAMREILGFELSFGSQIGMSGGPVVDKETGRVIGMLSFGLPPDEPVKTHTFAVSITEIYERIGA